MLVCVRVVGLVCCLNFELFAVHWAKSPWLHFAYAAPKQTPIRRTHPVCLLCSCRARSKHFEAVCPPPLAHAKTHTCHMLMSVINTCVSTCVCVCQVYILLAKRVHFLVNADISCTSALFFLYIFFSPTQRLAIFLFYPIPIENG